MSTKFGFVLGAVACFAAAAGLMSSSGFLSGMLIVGGFYCIYKAGTAKN